MDTPFDAGRGLRRLAVLASLALLSGCAFDVVSVKQLPVTLSPAMDPKEFILDAPAEVRIGTGFPVRLKAHTTWHRTGVTPHGEVYATTDQILTVEASNIHEAALVVRDDAVVGFYLLIEKKFCPATQPVKLTLTCR